MDALNSFQFDNDFVLHEQIQKSPADLYCTKCDSDMHLPLKPYPLLVQRNLHGSLVNCFPIERPQLFVDLKCTTENLV